MTVSMKRPPGMRARIVYVPADYKQPCELGWCVGAEGRIELDTGGPARYPGEVWFMSDEEDTSPGKAPP